MFKEKEIFERPVLFLPIQKVLPCWPYATPTILEAVDPNDDETVRGSHRQMLKQDSVRQAKDGCIRADAEGERDNGSCCKSRILPQLPKGVAKVLGQSVHISLVILLAL
jgi:hypothetical protein